MSEDRIQLAQDLLKEAVYRARARQAAGVAISGGGLDRPSGSGCGLGDPGTLDLDLTERGEKLFHRIWPRETAPTEVARVKGIILEWVDRSDAIDRKRNHFLRDFRQSHGFDRRAYSEELATAFEQGLERINDEANLGLRHAAEALLAGV